MKSVLVSTSVTNFSRSASARLRSVMSRTIFDAPTTLPASSLIGEIVSDTGMRRPSDRTRSVSKCSIRCPAFRLAMIWSSSAMRSGGNDEGDVAADGLLGGVAEEPLGRRVPALNDAVERLADDGVVRGFDDRREQAGRHAAGSPCRCSRRRCAVTSRKIRTHPETWPRSSLIGAALSSIGALAAVLPNQERVVRQADDDALAQRLGRRDSRPAAACLR